MFPSKVRLASEFTVLELTEVTILLFPEFVYVVIAAEGSPVSPAPFPKKAAPEIFKELDMCVALITVAAVLSDEPVTPREADI